MLNNINTCFGIGIRGKGPIRTQLMMKKILPHEITFFGQIYLSQSLPTNGAHTAYTPPDIMNIKAFHTGDKENQKKKR